MNHPIINHSPHSAYHPGLKIYIDRLKEGHVEQIAEEIAADFLDLAEPELAFPEPVFIQGEAYLAEDHLILRLETKTQALIPCSICNEPVSVEIAVADIYHPIPLEELSSPILDYSAYIREALLLQTPAFVECIAGKCPERATLAKYLKKPQEETPPVQENYPFSELENTQ